MAHEDDVFAALAYRRNVGATPSEIRAYLGLREEPKRSKTDDLKALQLFEKQGIVLKVGEAWFLTSQGYRRAKGSALRAEWQFSDAWILAAILYSRKLADCRLLHLIAAADFINHGLPSLAEMHGALNRLLSGRLIRIRSGVTFVPTEAALGLLAKAEATSKKQVMQIVYNLRKLLDCPCCGVALKNVRWRIQLDQATMDQAYREYDEMTRSKKKRVR